MEPRRVLVVDDDLDLAEGLQVFLHFALPHTEVARASSAHEALDLIDARATEGKPFDLVITDHTMPGLTGADLLERVAIMHPDALRVVFTGHDESISSSLQQGRANAVVLKPDVAALLDVADAVLATRRRARA